MNYPDATEREEIAKKTFATFLSLLKETATFINYELKVDNCNDDEINFSLNNIPFTLTWGEHLETLSKVAYYKVMYNLCTWKMLMATREEPEESLDVELISSCDYRDCLRKAFNYVTLHETDCALEAAYQSHHQEEGIGNE